MKYLIILSLFVINSANAIDYEKVMQESKALNKKYCDLKVKIACTQLLCEEDPGKCPEVSEIPDPKFSQSQKEELAKVKPAMDKCGQDMQCITKLLDQAAQKDLEAIRVKCKSGEQDFCYYADNYEQTKKLMGN